MLQPSSEFAQKSQNDLGGATERRTSSRRLGLPTRSIEAGDKSKLDRVGRYIEDDRNRHGCPDIR